MPQALVTYSRESIASDPDAHREAFTGLLAAANICVTLVRPKRGNFQNVGFMSSCITAARSRAEQSLVRLEGTESKPL